MSKDNLQKASLGIKEINSMGTSREDDFLYRQYSKNPDLGSEKNKTRLNTYIDNTLRSKISLLKDKGEIKSFTEIINKALYAYLEGMHENTEDCL